MPGRLRCRRVSGIADRPLDESDLDPDPFPLFRLWFEQAVAAGIHEPNAFVLATSTWRACLRCGSCCQGLDDRGFAFFTNYDSRKGNEMAANPRAAMVFPWPSWEAGAGRGHGRGGDSGGVGRVRPHRSRLAARRVGVASEPAAMPDREFLERRMPAHGEYPDGNVPRPPNWGGYRPAASVRVLAGAAQPPARPHPLPPRRRWLADRAPRALAAQAPAGCPSAWRFDPRKRRQRATTRSAVRERLDRDAVVALAHAELVGGAAGGPRASRVAPPSCSTPAACRRSSS